MLAYSTKRPYLCAMFIREVKKQRSQSSQTFYQYSLVQASRVDGKVVQRVILYLGSDPLFRDANNRNSILTILKSKIFQQEDLFLADIDPQLSRLALDCFDKYCLKYDQDDNKGRVSLPPAADKAEYHNIDLLGLQVTDVKSFGAEHLCAQVLDKLELRQCLTGLGMSEEQSQKALISIISRAIFAKSEHKTAQILALNSDLLARLGYKKTLTHKQLYAIADQLYALRVPIDRFLYERIQNMFDLEDKLVIFDISNTYFESRKAGSKIAKHGRSKEKRGDCPLVVFTGVINAEGFIRHSRIYEGNKPDTATLTDMLEDLKKNASPNTKQTVVMDAGIATEENLELLRKEKYDYVCVSRKRMKEYSPAPDQNQVICLTDREKNEVKLSIFKPQGYPDTWMYVQSEAKRAKERSMADKLNQSFEQDIQSAQDALQKKGGTKKLVKVWERIGKLKEKHKRVSGQYDITITDKDGMAQNIAWTKKEKKDIKDKENGVYFIRTNIEKPQEAQLWQIYNTIREVESTFRCLKSDLNIRPVHHQNDERIQSHIYLTILAYQLVNTIRYMLKQHNLFYDWANILRLMATQTIQTIKLPTDKKTIYLRKPSMPDQFAMEIYKNTNCQNTSPPTKKYVVYH